jgi:hypothetical protein
MNILSWIWQTQKLDLTPFSQESVINSVVGLNWSGKSAVRIYNENLKWHMFERGGTTCTKFILCSSGSAP